MQKSKKIFETKKKSANSFFIYGNHAVIAALQNPARKKNRLLVTHKTYPIYAKFDKLLPIEIISKQEFSSAIKANETYQEVALEVLPLSYNLADVVEGNPDTKALIIILDQVADPHNVGAILRSAAAFNVLAVINTIDNAPPENATIAKTASGALDIVPYIPVTNITTTITYLKDKGFWCYGLDGYAEHDIPQTFANKTCIILGNEERGIRKLVKENCDLLYKINISNKMESLNVSNAASIAMHYIYNYSSTK